MVVCGSTFVCLVSTALPYSKRWAIWRSTSVQLATGSAAVLKKMECIGSSGQGMEMPDAQKAKGTSSEARVQGKTVHLMDGYAGSGCYPEVASMAPGHCQARHCQAHGKAPLAARGAF